MIDINLIRENKEKVKENIKKKFQDHKLPLVDEVEALDKEYRDVKAKGDQLRGLKNAKSSEIGALMREGKKEDAEKVKEEIYKISKKEKIDINNIEIVEPNNDKRYEKYVEKYLELSKKFKVTKEEASKCLLDPLYFGMMMVKLGDGDRTCCWS